MSRIRVLNIITRLEQGGAPKALLETIRRMSFDRFQVDLAAGQTNDPLLDITGQVAKEEFSLIPVPALKRDPHPVRDLQALKQLVQIIRNGGYHLVHTHTAKAGFLGRLAAKICGIKAVVHSPHGTVLDGYFNPFITHFYAFLEHLTAPMADRIIGLTALEISQYLQAQIGDPDQYTYIYNGIDVEGFSAPQGNHLELRESLGVSPDAPVCISVGRLVPVKGQDDLLVAFQKAHLVCPDLHLWIVGEGVLRSELEDLAQNLGIAPQVRFLGWQDNVAPFLDAADLFVLPSLNEGLGLVLVEAMAKQLPVIATRVGGVPEVVAHGQTGLLVPSQSPSDLARSIVQLVQNPAGRKKMGQAGLERAKGHFSIQSTVGQTEALYHDLLGTPL
ncbi:MAG: glycosyltransferase family 4 protein [bacterium]|nr:glycosyltransferase family 4 protein [bacterium]